MANRQEELVLAIEELTGTMKRQTSITETMGQAVQAAMTSSENLKAAMLKTGSFQEGKMLGAIKDLSNMPGRVDKVIQGMGQFLNQGLGEHSKTFHKVVSQISALGLDNGPFLQLARSMNAKMGMSVEQQTEQLKSLMNLRVVTGQNPELMAKALAAQSQTFEQAAGIWGPGFSEKLMNSMKIMAQGRGGQEMVAKMMNMLKPLLEAGPEGMAKRAALNQGRGPKLHENMSQQEMIQWIMTSMESMGSNPAFQSAITRSVTGGGLLGMGGGAEFQTAQQMRSRLRGHTAGSLTADLARTGGDMDDLAGPKGQGAEQLLSTKLYSVVNQFSDVLPEAITIVTKSLDGLAGSAAGLADKFAGWLKGKANQGAGIIAGGVTSARGTLGDMGGEGGILSAAMSGGGDFLKGGWKVISNSVMLLVKAFTEGGALGALGDILKGLWGWLANSLPRHLRNFWAEGKAKLKQMLDFLGTIMQAVSHTLKAVMTYLGAMVPYWVELLAAGVSAALPFGMDEDDYEVIKGGAKTVGEAQLGLLNTDVTRAFGGSEFERRRFKGKPIMHMGDSTYKAEEAGEEELANNVMLSDAFDKLGNAFTEGPQLERLQNIEDGLVDMWKISKDAWDEVLKWVRAN